MRSITPASVGLSDEAIVAAIQHGRVAQLAADALRADPAPADAGLAARIAETCRRITDEVRTERHRLASLLAAASVGVDLRDAEPTMQRHELRIDVSPDDAPAAIELLERDGYERHPRWRRGAARSFWATADAVTLTRPGAWTSVVRLRWSPATPPGGLRRLVRPSAADWDLVELPTALWWAYPLLRPLRLGLERLGLRDDDHSALEPFLSTPTSLIEPLLQFAGVDEHDTLADIGCGDGRLLIEGARRFGCRAYGIEHDPSRVRAARSAAREAGVEHLVRLEQGDGLAADLSDVTVVVVFLPVGVAARVVPALVGRLRPGARVVAHEQSPLRAGMDRPDRSKPVVGTDALTVAHLWTVSASV